LQEASKLRGTSTALGKATTKKKQIEQQLQEEVRQRLWKRPQSKSGK